jgi:hypothetical protein
MPWGDGLERKRHPNAACVPDHSEPRNGTAPWLVAGLSRYATSMHERQQPTSLLAGRRGHLLGPHSCPSPAHPRIIYPNRSCLTARLAREAMNSENTRPGLTTAALLAVFPI